MGGFPLSLTEWVILSFAAFRFTQFFVFDSLMGFNPESGSKMSNRLDGFAYNKDGSNRSYVRGKIGDLLTCPWCLGFWLSTATYLLFVISTHSWSSTPILGHVLGAFAVAGGQGFLNEQTK